MLYQMLSQHHVSNFDRAYIVDQNNTIIHATEPGLTGENVIVKAQYPKAAQQFLDNVRKQKESEFTLDQRHFKGISLGEFLLILVSDKPAMYGMVSSIFFALTMLLDCLHNLGVV